MSLNFNPIDALKSATDIAKELITDGDKRAEFIANIYALKVQAAARWSPQGIVAVVSGVGATIVLMAPAVAPIFGAFVPFVPEIAWFAMGFAFAMNGIPMEELGRLFKMVNDAIERRQKKKN